MQTQPNIYPFCKSSVNKSEILTSQLQKRLDFAVLVKGLFLTGKKFFPFCISHRTKTESLFAPPVKQGCRPKIYSADLIGQFGGLP
jgi:hypothetical protein